MQLQSSACQVFATLCQSCGLPSAESSLRFSVRKLQWLRIDVTRKAEGTCHVVWLPAAHHSCLLKMHLSFQRSLH